MDAGQTSLLFRSSLRELVEDVKVSFVVNLANYPTLLQEIIRNLSADWLSFLVEHDL
jgi:hypothetical protein